MTTNKPGNNTNSEEIEELLKNGVNVNDHVRKRDLQSGAPNLFQNIILPLLSLCFSRNPLLKHVNKEKVSLSSKEKRRIG